MINTLVFIFALYTSLNTFFGICYDCVNNTFTQKNDELPRILSFMLTSVLWGIFYFLTHK